MGDAMSTVSNVIVISNDCLGIGQFAFDKIATHLKVIAGIGGLIKDMIGVLNPRQPDPIMLKLVELDRKLDRLSDQMMNQFNDLKSFMAEHHFYAEIAQTASTLMKFMRDTISNPGHDSINIFRDVCSKNPPLQYAYRMISLLEQDSTNPLKMAMRADDLRKRETFNKWKNIIDGVLAQFLFLETFVNGMFWDQNMYGPDQLKQKIEEVNRKMRQWENEYKNDDSYWPGVKRLVERTQDHRTDVGNDEKAVILQGELMKILTDHVFYIIVYNDCSGYDRHSFSWNGDNVICSFRRGWCNVVIYRSHHWMHAGRNALHQMESDVDACKLSVIQ